MFNFVQNKKRLVQIVLALIILPFAFFGMDSYQNSDGGEALATVDGEKIGQQEFDNALRQQQDRMREMLGNNYDPAMFDQPESKRSVLGNLVTQRLLMLQARAAGLAVSDSQLAQAIAGIEAFQQDGKFDKQRYETALRGENMSSQTFEMRVAQELGMRQLTNAYTQNGYASHTAADNLMRLNEQQRVIAVAEITHQPFLQSVIVDESAVKSYYETKQKEFQTEEQVRVEYLIFQADALQAQVTVDEGEIRKYYEEHQPEFGTQEQRHAAHILIALTPQASGADKQAVRTRAEQVLQQAKQSPGKFAELAKQHSQDTGSAANGGDLGLFGRGMMVKPFEDAVFKLSLGEISGLVQSDFGLHIIQLLAIKAAKTQPFNEVRNDVAQKLKLQKANDKFPELTEKFSNMVYEQSDTLASAAELVKMPLQQSAWLSRGQAEMPPWTGKALQAVFSEDVIKNKRNSAAIEIAPNTLLAVRLLEHKPVSIRPLAEVSGGIRQKLLRQRAVELASAQGKATLEKLQRGEKAGVQWQPAVTVTRETLARLDNNNLTRLVFQVNPGKLPAYVGVENAQGGYLLAQVQSVKDVAAIDDASRLPYLQKLRQLTGEELFQAYLEDAKKHANISMKSFVADKK